MRFLGRVDPEQKAAVCRLYPVWGVSAYLVWGVPAAVAAGWSLLPRGCKDEVHSGAVVPGPRIRLHVPDSVGLQSVGMELPEHIQAQLSYTMVYISGMAVLSRMCIRPSSLQPCA